MVQPSLSGSATCPTSRPCHNPSRSDSALADLTPDAVCAAGLVASCWARRDRAGMSHLSDLCDPFLGHKPRDE